MTKYTIGNDKGQPEGKVVEWGKDSDISAFAGAVAHNMRSDKKLR